ncbi:MAG: hypothetical protein IJ859_03190 [Synergistaceae bacterium]|nr:hypothetical protein [Synergistaceae bacterium]
MEKFEDTEKQGNNPTSLIQQDQITASDGEKIAQDSSTPDEIIQEIVSVKTSSVDKILLDLNKISQKAFNTGANTTLYQGIPRKMAMERKGSEKEVNTFVAINFDSNGMAEKGLTIKGTEKLTQFDRIVLDAINTLYFEGHNEYITTAMVFHVITGDTNRRITPNYTEEINDSLKKLLFTHIVIKANEEAIMYPELKNFEYHDNIVPGAMVKAKLNGIEVACIHIRDIPPLYLYANKKNQICKISLDLIKLPFAGEKNEGKEHMTLLYYLLRRIVALKSISNCIKYDTIYHELGHDNATKQKKLKIRKKVKEILDAWKGSLFGDIEFTDYDEKKEGQVPKELIIKFIMQKDKKEN